MRALSWDSNPLLFVCHEVFVVGRGGLDQAITKNLIRCSGLEDYEWLDSCITVAGASPGQKDKKTPHRLASLDGAGGETEIQLGD